MGHLKFYCKLKGKDHSKDKVQIQFIFHYSRKNLLFEETSIGFGKINKSSKYTVPFFFSVAAN